NRTFRQFLSRYNRLSWRDFQAGPVRDGVHFRLRLPDDFDFPAVPDFPNVLDDAADFGHRGLPFRITGFKQLLHPRQTLRDVVTGHTTAVERPHGQLGPRLTDGLGRDDADGFANFYLRARGQVAAITQFTHPVVAAASEHRTNVHFFDAQLHDFLGPFVPDHLEI